MARILLILTHNKGDDQMIIFDTPPLLFKSNLMS